MVTSSSTLKVSTVKEWVGTLSNSQGYYGRLYNHLSENNLWGKFTKELNNNKVSSMLDMVMFIEC